VTGSNDFNLKLWDVKTGQEKSVLAGHMSAITGVAYSVRQFLLMVFTVGWTSGRASSLYKI